MNELKELIEQKLDRFILQELLDNDDSKLLRDYCKGGKKLRAIAMIKAFENFVESEKIYNASLSIELLHVSSLIFDDLMDEDDYRRGKPGIQLLLKQNYPIKGVEYNGNVFSNTKKRYAASRAMLVGLLCEMLAQTAILKSGFDSSRKISALTILNNSYKELCYGQILDITMENQNNVSEKEYIDMIFKKTGSLFSSGMMMGAVLAGKEDMLDYFMDYGRHISIAFQIYDDLMDVDSTMKKGRKLGSDIIKGKKTILLIKALEKDHRVRDYIGKEDNIEKVIQIYNETGSIEYARQLALRHVNKAKIIIQQMNLKEEFFNNLTDFVIKRKE